MRKRPLSPQNSPEDQTLKSSRHHRTLGRILQVLSVAVLCCVLIVTGLRTLRERRTDSVSFDTVREAVTTAFLQSLPDASAVQESDSSMIQRLYQIDPSQLEGVVLYTPSSNMGAEELILIKASSSSQMESIQEALENRRQAQIQNFSGYGVEQTAMLEKSQIVIQGTFALFVSSPDPSVTIQAFESVLP